MSKKASLEWAHNKRLKDEQEIKYIEDEFQPMYDSDGGGYDSQESKDHLGELEGKKIVLLAEQVVWRLKAEPPGWQAETKTQN